MAHFAIFYIWLPLTLLSWAKNGRSNFSWNFYKVSNAAYYVLYSSRSPRCTEGGGLKSPPPPPRHFLSIGAQRLELISPIHLFSKERLPSGRAVCLLWTSWLVMSDWSLSTRHESRAGSTPRPRVIAIPAGGPAPATLAAHSRRSQTVTSRDQGRSVDSRGGTGREGIRGFRSGEL